MFRSFFLAGFEGSTGYNRHGQWFDQVVATGHHLTVDQDYWELAALGLHAARETVRWPLVDLGDGRYDFSTLEPFVEAARRHGVEVIWDLFHYGFPRGLDLEHPSFAARFADYCHAVARYIAERTEGTCWFTPVNEPSFLAYAGGEKALFAPHLEGRGWELKIALARAGIVGIDAIRAACPAARIVNVDPFCRVAAPPDRPDLAEEVRDFNDRLVFQSWDMLCGRLLPELGGSPAHLDVVGVNYYWTNQWELGGMPDARGVIPPLADDDPRRLPLSDLIETVWQRYRNPLIVSEIAHVGEQRGPLVRELARETEILLARGVPIGGICLYPILGMPEWHEPDVWVAMGLWDPVCHRDPAGPRVICEPMRDALADIRYIDSLHRRTRMGDAKPLRHPATPPSHPPGNDNAVEGRAGRTWQPGAHRV